MIKLAAVIIESRPLSHLQEKIAEHMYKLPEQARLFAFLSPSAESVCKEVPVEYIEPLQEPFDLNDYNRLLTSPDFWQQFLDYDRVLIFQADSGILRSGIEEFYEFDYIGAPWRFSPYRANGGLSLRNPKIMLEILNRYPWNGIINEDVWFCLHMHDFKIGNLAPTEICSKFSCESMFAKGTWGYHAIDSWLSSDECKFIRNQYL